MGYIKEYFSALVDLTNEMAPYILLGFLIAGILHVYFPDEKINRLLGAKNIKSVFKAALIGVPLPLCSCGVIPTAISLFKHGASKGSTVSFLISTPQTGVDSIMVTYSLIGLPFAIIRVLVAFITGIFGGLITNFFVKDDKETVKMTVSENTNKNRSLFNSVSAIFKYAFFDFIKDIAKWLVIGLLIAALITVVVPQDFFTTYVNNRFLTMLIILAISVPLYVCATGSVPIAAALIMKGISPGAALVFLMAGPATNAATMTVIGKVMGRKTLFAYLGTIIGGALLFGTLIDLFIPASFLTKFLTTGHMHLPGHEHEVLPQWLKIVSSLLFTFFILYALLIDFLTKNKKQESPVQIDTQSLKLVQNMSRVTVSVKGMTCNHCKMTVENGLKQFPEFTDVNADLRRESVTLSGENIDLEKIKMTVESLGYKYGGELA